MKQFVKIVTKRFIGNSYYKKNIVIMMTSRIVAQIIPILLTPLLTRLYTPEEFGVFGVFIAIVSLVSMLSNGRYCLAIVVAKDKEESKGLVLLCSILTAISSLLFYIFLLLWGEGLFILLDISTLSNYLLVLVSNILFVGLYEALFYYVIREKGYRVLGTNVIVQAVSLIMIRIVFGLLGFTNIGLLLSSLVSYVVGYFLLLFRLDINFGKSFSISYLLTLLKKYINFPKFSLFADTLKTFTVMSPSIFFNKVFGIETAGYYSMTDKVLGSPTWFITSSVGDVFKQEASEQYRQKGTSYPIFIKTVRSLFFIGIVPFLLVFLLSPTLIPILLGSNWEPVGLYIQIFSIMYFARFVVNPVSYIFYVVDKLKINALFEGLKFISIIIGFTVGFYLSDLVIGLLVWSLLSTLIYVITFLVSKHLVKNLKYVGTD